MFFEVCTFGFEDFIFISRSLTRQSYDQFLVENCQLNKITNLYCSEVSSCQIVC